ncbi:hypothetical protein FQR65_LT17885 [Abscondita terminalis]|nr:hypothetical protein FQR65_LT17885 [Abscondita terminalis]
MIPVKKIYRHLTGIYTAGAVPLSNEKSISDLNIEQSVRSRLPLVSGAGEKGIADYPEPAGSGYAYDDRINQMGLKQFFISRAIRLHPLVILGGILGLLGYFFDPFTGPEEVLSTSRMILIIVFTLLLIPFPVMKDKVYNMFGLNASGMRVSLLGTDIPYPVNRCGSRCFVLCQLYSWWPFRGMGKRKFMEKGVHALAIPFLQVYLFIVPNGFYIPN